MPEADFPIQLVFIHPHEEHWRELMLDLGAPLDAGWEIWVTVHDNHIRDDMPYNISETAFIQDLRSYRSGERIGETEVSDSDLALFNPIYVMRTRFFLFDEPPIPENVPPVSPLFPAAPFIEIKTHRLAPPGADVHSTISFQIGSVPAAKQADEFLRLFNWWKVYAVNRHVITRSGWSIEQIQVWTDQAIEKMARESRKAGKIARFSLDRFRKAFPYGTSRPNLYNYLAEEERKGLKARYLRRCAELMAGEK